MTDETPVTITVDGREVEACPGEMLITAAQRAGTFIPRFCHHDRMQPVGMCRMCLVDVDTGRGPMLQPSCMVPVGDGMIVDTKSDRTQRAQEGILELLLANHPLDCPVCDKGGECPLQDQTMSYGPGESRFVEEKRHYEKPIAISDNVYLDRERCILCDRCTRFADEVAGDPLIHFIERGNQTQVNTFPNEPFSSYFSGNTVQACPVGALTATPFRFKARPWDLEAVESTSTTDSVGSRIVIQSSRDQVLRYLGVDSDPVNWGWLSDKERFSFEYVNSDGRLTVPLMADGDDLVETTWSAALAAAAEALAGADPGAVGFVGGARLTNEAQYAWTRLAKGVIGTDNLDAQLADGLPAEVVMGLPRATIDQACEKNGTIILLGPDPKEELAALFLRLRHAVVFDGAKLIELTPQGTGLSGQAQVRLHARPGEQGAVARAIVTGEISGEVGGVAEAALRAAHALVAGDGPVTVVLGRASLADDASFTVDAAQALASIDGVRFLSALRRGNVHGALDMGMAPGLLPGRQDLVAGRSTFEAGWGQTPTVPGLDSTGILEAAADGRLDVLVLLGADPLVDFPDADLAERAVTGARTVIAVDLFHTASVDRADLVLPAAGFAETDGTTTNLEGRVTVLRQKVTPPGTARADWMIAAELGRRLGSDFDTNSPTELWAQVVARSAAHADLDLDTLSAPGNGDGLVVGAGSVAAPAFPEAEVPAHDGHGFRLVVDRKLYDSGSQVRFSPSLAGLAPGTTVRVAWAEADKLGIDDGTTVSVVSPAGTLRLPLERDASVPAGIAAVAFAQGDHHVGELIDHSSPVTDIRIEKG